MIYLLVKIRRLNACVILDGKVVIKSIHSMSLVISAETVTGSCVSDDDISKDPVFKSYCQQLLGKFIPFIPFYIA